MKLILTLLFFFSFSLSAFAHHKNVIELEKEVLLNDSTQKIEKKIFSLPMFVIQRVDKAKKD